MQTALNPECTPPTKAHSLFHKSEESAPIAQRKLRQEDQANLPQYTLSVRLSKSEVPPLSRTQSNEKCPPALPGLPWSQTRNLWGFSHVSLSTAEPGGFSHPGVGPSWLHRGSGSTQVPARSHRARQPYLRLSSPAVPNARLLSCSFGPQPHKGLGAQFQPRPERSGVKPRKGPLPEVRNLLLCPSASVLLRPQVTHLKWLCAKVRNLDLEKPNA